MIYPVNYSGYATNAQTQRYAHFVGSNPIESSVIQPSFKASQASSQDVVQISAGDKIKESSNSEKTGMSTGAKWALGLGATVLAGIAAHKFIPPMRVQSRVQRIFLEDFTKEEAKAIQKKYQDILKITEKDEFLDKLFTELKKDYKLDNIPIKLDKNFKSGERVNDLTAGAHFTPDHSKAYLSIGVDRTFDNKQLLRSITHELRHAKQDLLNYQVSTRDDLISVYKERLKDFAKSEKANWNQEKIDENAQEMVDEIINFYKKLNIQKLDRNDRNYEFGRQILDSFRTYANQSNNVYRSTLYETDAKNTEKIMERLVNNRLWN